MSRLRNLRFVVSFSGKGLLGFQKQPHGQTVEGLLLQAWKTLTREQAQIIACSRLDAAVDADHFVFNLHTETSQSCDDLVRGLNGILGSVMKRSICIYSVEECDPSFHSRFDTIGKHYRYLIWYGRSRHHRYLNVAWHVRTKNLNSDLHLIAQEFVGTRNFAAYRSQDCAAKNTTKTLHAFHYWTSELFPELGVFDVWGDGFLKNMIRNIVGTVVDVGSGKLGREDIKSSFQHLDRTQTGQCAPGHGLCLKQVFYSQKEYLQSCQHGARNRHP